MLKLMKKIERLEPVISIKKRHVDEASLSLAAVRRERMDMESELVKWQQRYVSGVTNLNVERESANRSMLSALESSVDHAREKLFEIFNALKEMDRRESAATLHLGMVQRDLSAVEKLQGKHKEALIKDRQKRENMFQDEIGLRRFLQHR